MSPSFRTLFFVIGVFEIVLSDEREHKVHNIVLYPEKHSWCQITPIQQIVASPGYEPVTIDNNVCVGACFSYSIPKTQPAEPGELIGPYCDSCQPSEIKLYHINLRKNDTNIEGPTVFQKRVQIITYCSCQNCAKFNDISEGNTLELPQNLFTDEKNLSKSIADDLPELLEAHSALNPNFENNVRLKNNLIKLFELDQDELDSLKNDEMYSQKNKPLLYKIDLDHNEENNIKIENDLKNLPESFGIERARGHLKGSRMDLGTEHNENDIIKAGSSGRHGHQTGHQQIREGHHHLGEEEYIGMNVVHLVKGPHGSMVAAPVEAKLHIDPYSLKPNSEGVIIDYENHNKNENKLEGL